MLAENAILPKKALIKGLAPSVHPKASKKALRAATEHTFESILMDVFCHSRPTYSAKITGRREKQIFPHITKHPLEKL